MGFHEVNHFLNGRRSSTPRSSRCEAADRMATWVSVSLVIGILHSLEHRHALPPPKPRIGHEAGGAGSQAHPCAQNGHSTALFTDGCQSFFDNVIACVTGTTVCTESFIRIELVMKSRHAGGDDRPGFPGSQPIARPIQRTGRIASNALLGGLHHQYVRI